MHCARMTLHLEHRTPPSTLGEFWGEIVQRFSGNDVDPACPECAVNEIQAYCDRVWPGCWLVEFNAVNCTATLVWVSSKVRPTNPNHKIGLEAA